MIKSRRILLTIKLYLRQESYHFRWSIGRCTSMDTTPNWKFKRSHCDLNKMLEFKDSNRKQVSGPPSSAKNVEASKFAATTLRNDHLVWTLKQLLFCLEWWF